MTSTYSVDNPFIKYIEYAETHTNEFSEEMKLLFNRQRRMLEKFDFIEEKGRKCVEWIERCCVLTEGENAGKRVKLHISQKWFIYSILCFYGNLKVETFDDEGNFTGYENKYVRVVNDVLYLIGTGNAKTTLLGFLNAYFLYHEDVFPSCKIYIGSNAYKQSRLCFDTTMNIIKRNKKLRKYASIRKSTGEIEIEKTNAKLIAMSSDGSNLEGIIPAVLIIDEIHEMKTSAYADNLRKSTKRDDFLIIETTTQGTVRGGYLDERLELANSTLRDENEIEEYRKLFVIYKQDNEEEISIDNVPVLKKSNPLLSVAVSVQMLKDKIIEMKNDPRKRITTLVKNFNIPQNPITSYFSEVECKTKTFNEDIFYNAPVFLGLDMAYTRNPFNDLTALRMMMVNPFTNEEYSKDFYFLPKWWIKDVSEDGVIKTEKLDMIAEKSKVDTNILYNKKQNKYGYQLYADRGDVVIVDDELVQELVDEFGEQARCDTTGITEEFVIYYIAHLERKYNWILCKFGLDPNKASKLKAFAETNIISTDGKNPVISFRIEDKKNSNPIILSTKDIRKQGKVYNNNRLTELHFAGVQSKEDQYGNITFVNPMYSRKDGVIAELSARSSYNVYITNKDTGSQNLERLKDWWRDNEERLNGILSRGGVQESEMAKR